MKKIKDQNESHTMFILRKLNIVQISIILKLIYSLCEIPTEIPAGFLIDTDKTIKQFFGKAKKKKKMRIAKTIIKKEEESGRNQSA